MNHAAQTVATALGEVVAAQRAQVGAVGELGQVTAQVLESQTALQAVMAHLRESGLAGVLAGLDSSLRDLKPLLSNLSQAFVLQAVPASPRESRTAGTD